MLEPGDKIWAAGAREPWSARASTTPTWVEYVVEEQVRFTLENGVEVFREESVFHCFRTRTGKDVSVSSLVMEVRLQLWSLDFLPRTEFHCIAEQLLATGEMPGLGD